MVDTARNKAYALATLFANNTSGDITPQDMRDFVESVAAWIGGSTYPRPLKNQVLENQTLNGSGATLEVLNVAGAGTVKRIWYTTDHFDRGLCFDFYFNGEGSPSIVLKAADMICARGVAVNYYHRYFGQTYLSVDAQAGYLSLEMPYQDGCIIKCRNPSGSACTLFSEVDYSYGVDLTSDRRGKICAAYLDTVTLPAAYGSADAAVSTTNTTLVDTRKTFTSAWVGYTAYCNGKYLVVTSVPDVNTLTGSAGWSGGGNPGNGYKYTVTKEHDLLPTVTNRGEFIGLWLHMAAPWYGANMEGNFRFYRDGESTPSYTSSGTEDFFLAGWYWEAETPPTTLGPDAGLLVRATDLAAYRFFLNDRMPFDTSLRVTWENGQAGIDSCCPVVVTCIAWYYIDDGATL